MAASSPRVVILGEGRRPLHDLYHALLVRRWAVTLADGTFVVDLHKFDALTPQPKSLFT